MKKGDKFPFERARKITPSELKSFRKAYENTFGVKPPRRGRPPKGPDKYRDVHIKLHPAALEAVKEKARRRGMPYQTLINEILLRDATAG